MDTPLYHARIEGTATDQTNRATVRETHTLELDEPSWSDRGSDQAPCPVDYLLVAVAGCQVETLRYCLEQSRVGDYEIDAAVGANYRDAADRETGIPNPTANEVATIRTSLEVTTTAEHEKQAHRCLDHLAKHGCIVSRSLEPAIDVRLETAVRVDAADDPSAD